MRSPLPSLWEDVESANWLHLTEDETVQWTGRPSRFTIAVAILGGITLAILGLVLTIWLRTQTSLAGAPAVVGYLPLVLTALGIGWAGTVYLDWLRLLYVITDDVIYVKHGLVSRDVTQIRLDRVQNTSFEQSILERFLRYGDVQIYTAGTGTEDLTFRNVPNPEQVCQLLTVLLSDRPEMDGDALRFRRETAENERLDGA